MLKSLWRGFVAPRIAYRVADILRPEIAEMIRGAASNEAAARPGEPQAPRTLRTLSELDAEIGLLREAEKRSFSEWAGLRSGFRFHEDIATLPADPYSTRYRDAQLELYYKLAGVGEYNPWHTEPIPISVKDSIDPYPFPFSTKDPEHIGNHFLALGHILRALKAARPDGRTLLEYGCGTGFTTIFLAASGYDVTAVDINAEALAVVDALAQTRKLPIRTFNGVFGQVPDEAESYDLIVFYESFHHCLDFQELLHTLHSRISTGGAVVFAGEPIFADFPKPWGLRLDGASLWEIRTRGWLELGFNEEFFYNLLSRHDWDVSKQTFQLSPDLFIAKQK